MTEKQKNKIDRIRKRSKIFEKKLDRGERLTSQESKELDEHLIYTFRLAKHQLEKVSSGHFLQLRHKYEQSKKKNERLEKENRYFRVLLWRSCRHDMKYGDDGELQCGGLDFKRCDPVSIARHLFPLPWEKQ